MSVLSTAQRKRWREYWHDVMAEFIQHVTFYRPPHDVVDRLYKRWMRNKKELLAQLGPEGKMELQVSIPQNTWDDYYRAHSMAIDMLYKRAREQEDWDLLRRCPGAIEVALSELEAVFERSELIHNRLRYSRKIDHGRPLLEGAKVSRLIPRVFGPSRAERIRHRLLNCTLSEKALASLLSQMAEASQIGYAHILSLLAPREETMVISVDPLDMALASEFTNGWTSCHRILGPWRTGPWSYLLDAPSAIVYTYQKKGGHRGFTFLGDQPLKRWRQTIHFDFEHQGAIFGRQYPSVLPNVFATARRWSAYILNHGSHPKRWRVRLSDLGNATSLVAPEEELQTFPVRLRHRARWHYPDNPQGAIVLDPHTDELSLSVGIATLPCFGCGSTRRSGPERFLCSHCQALSPQLVPNRIRLSPIQTRPVAV